MKERRFKLIEFWRNNRCTGMFLNPTINFILANTYRLPEDVSVTVWL